MRAPGVHAWCMRAHTRARVRSRVPHGMHVHLVAHGPWRTHQGACRCPRAHYGVCGPACGASTCYLWRVCYSWCVCDPGRTQPLCMHENLRCCPTLLACMECSVKARVCTARPLNYTPSGERTYSWRAPSWTRAGLVHPCVAS